MGDNMTSVTEFILLGFPLNTKTQMLLFGLFSQFYVLTVLGNGVILGLISLDSRLHTPMYFFLAIADMAYACSTVPQMLVNLLSPAKPISFAGCITQTFLFLTFAVTECLLLVVIWRVCIMLVVTSWTIGVLLSLVHLVLLIPLPFCMTQKIDHFFCEIMAVLKLACADTHINELMVLAGAVSVLVGPFSSVIISYVCIFRAILRLQLGEGQSKAFSTCSSHLCVVGLFYGTAIIMYVGPRYGNPKEQKKYLLLFHSLFNPMLNPLIYTLKNLEVKNAMKRVSLIQ
uniref:Uncharacterized protein n=1 Tax=Ovis aries TaxID=9940 RepID=A0AC11APY9_SHEEP